MEKGLNGAGGRESWKRIGHQERGETGFRVGLGAFLGTKEFFPGKRKNIAGRSSGTYIGTQL